MVLAALKERFGRVPKRVSNQILALPHSEPLKSLLRQALRCQNLKKFEEQLLKVK